jgi:hypothetical protein
MRVTLATWLVPAILAGGCRSYGAWTFVEDQAAEVARPELPSWPGHRAVENVHLEVYGRAFDFVGYRAAQPYEVDVREQREDLAVRASLQLDAGVSVLDVAVRGFAPNGIAERRISGSVFEAIPHFAEVAMADLRRVWGSESVFAVSGSHLTRRVTDGASSWWAVPLAGGVLAFAPQPGGALRVVFLDRDLVPRARAEYGDFDDDGVPREVRFTDLRRAHTLRVEVEEVHLVDDAVPASTFETPEPAR